jgi:hypothetical protein
VRGINGQMRALVSSLLNACASFPQGGRLPVDFAGMAQRNPLLHYTKKIVADATEHDDRGNGPHDEYGGHIFHLHLTKEERKREECVPGT